MTGAGHAQHSKEATIVCGLERFHFISGPALSPSAPSLGLTTATVLAGQFRHCSQCSCSGFCLSRLYFGLFQVVFPLQYQCTTATRDVIFHSVPAAAGHSKCSTTSADCTSTESHVFCFLTTAGSLSCTRKVSVAQQ